MQNEKILVTSQDIYNYKKQLLIRSLDGRTPIEALLDTLHQNGEKYSVARDAEGHLTHLYISPSQSLELAKTFYGVLLWIVHTKQTSSKCLFCMWLVLLVLAQHFLWHFVL